MSAHFFRQVRSAPLLASLALTALIVAALLAIPQIVHGVNLSLSITGPSTTFAPGDNVPFRLTVNLDDGDEVVDEFELSVTGPQTFNFTEIPLEAGALGPKSQSGAILRGNITITNVSFSGGYGYGGASGSRIVVIGTVQMPMGAQVGNYTLRARVFEDEDTTRAATTTFTIDPPETIVNPFAPTPAPPAASISSQVFNIPLPRAVNLATGQGGPNLTHIFRNALGPNVSILGGNAPFMLTPDGQLALQLAALGLSSGMNFNGSVSFTSGGLTLDTNNGSGTAEVRLSDRVTVRGDVQMVTRSSHIDIIFTNTQMSVQAPSPNADLLLGGNSAVTILGANFNVGLLNLPQNSSLDVQYGRDPSELLPNASSVFGDVADDMDKTFDMDDLAYVVSVTLRTISNDDLGDNTVLLPINSSWVDSRDDKTIVIVKVDDGGNAYAEEASCSAAGGDRVECQATFSGGAGGFSTFSLVALSEPDVAPTPTPTPVEPTPTPTPVEPTPTPVPPVEEPTGNLFIIILVVVLVIAIAAAGAFFYLRRRGEGASA